MGFMSLDLIKQLENWYNSRCDGDWEHEFGIKIDTLDNPGWKITIDIDEKKTRRLLILIEYL